MPVGKNVNPSDKAKKSNAKGTGVTVRGGRPGVTEPRIKKFILRMTLTERREIDNCCRNVGVDPSSFVRLSVFSTERLPVFDRDIAAEITNASATKNSLFMAFTGAEYFRLLERAKAYEASINTYCRLAAAQKCKEISTSVEALGPPIDLDTLDGKLQTTAESRIDRVKENLEAQAKHKKATKKK